MTGLDMNALKKPHIFIMIYAKNVQESVQTRQKQRSKTANVKTHAAMKAIELQILMLIWKP